MSLIIEKNSEKWMTEPMSGCFIWISGTIGRRGRHNDYPSVKYNGICAKYIASFATRRMGLCPQRMLPAIQARNYFRAQNGMEAI